MRKYTQVRINDKFPGVPFRSLIGRTGYVTYYNKEGKTAIVHVNIDGEVYGFWEKEVDIIKEPANDKIVDILDI